jgi:hypothetical protein
MAAMSATRNTEELIRSLAAIQPPAGSHRKAMGVVSARKP